MYCSPALFRNAFCMLCAAPFAPVAQAQTPLSVRPVQDLQFGFLIPGVATTVDALQLSRSGQLQLQATIGTTLEIRFTLPTMLFGTGPKLPVSFGSTSAGVSASSAPTDLVRFDPALPTRFKFTTTDRATIFLGGTANPHRNQRTGAYAAPVIVTITNLGL